MRRLDGGNCFIFGARPGTVESGIPGKRVGYMPQVILEKRNNYEKN